MAKGVSIRSKLKSKEPNSEGGAGSRGAEDAVMEAPSVEPPPSEPTTKVCWNGKGRVLLRGRKLEHTFEPGENTLPTRLWIFLQKESNGVRTLIARRELQEIKDV